MSLAPGTQLGPYVIIDQVGAGGMGEVYRARDHRLDRDVAIKVLPQHIAGDPTSRTRFEREAKTLAGLSHPNILSIFDVGKSGDVAYVVTELLQGCTLRDRMARGPMNWQEIALTATQIAEGLSAAHSRGIVHRDLKPENIFLTADKRIKILDFGLARMTATVAPDAATGSITPTTTVPGSVVGTLGYMSPEQVKGEPVDTRSDQFSFGCMLYQMLSGKRPFLKATVAETLAAILRDDPPGLRATGNLIPEELEAVTFRCLKKNPEERYPSTPALLEVLKSFTSAGFLNMVVRPFVPDKKSFRWQLLRLPLLIVTIAVFALFVPAGSKWIQSRQAVGPRHIAILPFKNIGEDPANQAFCDGLVETLASKLTQLEPFQQSLWVVPTSEVIGQEVTSATDAARKLGINMVITGSIQREGEWLQVTMNLIDATTSRQVQSEMIRLPASSISLFEENAITRLTAMLHLKVDPQIRKALADGSTMSSEAYSDYLQGVGYLERYESPESLVKAIDLFNKAIIADPKYALAYAGLGEAYSYLHGLNNDPSFLSQAELYCRRATELNPQSPEVLTAWAGVQRLYGHLEEAIKIFKLVLRAHPAFAAARSGLGKTLEDSGRLAEAEAEFKHAVDFRPDYWGGYNDLGSFYFYHGDFSNAGRMFESAVRLAPDNLKCLNNLAGAYYQMGKTQQAESAFKKIISIKPTAEAYSNLGTILFFKKQYNEASSFYQKAIQLQNENFGLWGNYGDALRYSGASEEQLRLVYGNAVKLSEEELRRTPGSSFVHASLSLFASRMNECGKARQEIARATELEPANPLVNYKAALVNELCGSHQEAVRSLTKAIDNGYPKEQLINDPDASPLLKDSISKPL